jgi:hypothetical protein
MPTRLCALCRTEEVNGRRRLCTDCREASRRESKQAWWQRNKDDVNDSRRIQGEAGEIEDDLWAGGPAFEEAGPEQPYRHVVSFFPSAESHDCNFYRGRRADRRGRMPDGELNPSAYGVMRVARAPVPDPRPQGFNRFGDSVERPNQVLPGHLIAPPRHMTDRGEQRQAAERAAAERAHLRSSLHFGRGM